MKIIASLLRLVAVTSFSALAFGSAASAKTPHSLSLAQTLEARGSIPVKAAGPYVEVGSYRIQVSTKLGRPAHRLSDESWLYENFTVEESDATGTLCVRFANGRVSELCLLSHKAAVALENSDLSKTARVAAVHSRQ